MGRLEGFGDYFTPGPIEAVSGCGMRRPFQLVLQAGQTCDVAIPAGSGFLRSADVELSEGARLTLELVEGASAGILGSKELRSGSEKDARGSIYVFGDAATLRLRCVRGRNATACRLRPARDR